tara:strand:+ start:3653 stop:3796 length:144 start_codon:yes stop_codon:yes gene_type:complete
LWTQQLNKGTPMPKVGKKTFPYTPKGKAKAKKEAKKTGKAIKAKRKY